MKASYIVSIFAHCMQTQILFWNTWNKDHLFQEAQTDGGSTDFFSILNIIFEYAFERNRINVTNDGETEISYLLRCGLVKTMTRVYKILSQQMIIDGNKVDRALAAFCKTCLSIFEELPEGFFVPRTNSMICNEKYWLFFSKRDANFRDRA